METAKVLRTTLQSLPGRFALATAIFIAPVLAEPVFCTPAQAEGVVQITPVLLDLTGPSAVGVIAFANQAHEPTSIQVRVFRWRQADGQESLQPTDDVVASPPRADIGPGESLSIRVVRAAQTPIEGEDSYRLVIDQLPEARDSGKAVVSILLRQVLPVFFSNGSRSAPNVTWSISRRGGQSVLVANNTGDRRLRIGKVTLSGHGGSVTMGGSLLGYVLAHSQMSWTIPAKSGGFAIGSTVAIRGQGDLGAISASAPVVTSP
jgi:fimbrial chaperone protein